MKKIINKITSNLVPFFIGLILVGLILAVVYSYYSSPLVCENTERRQLKAISFGTQNESQGNFFIFYGSFNQTEDKYYYYYAGDEKTGFQIERFNIFGENKYLENDGFEEFLIFEDSAPGDAYIINTTCKKGHSIVNSYLEAHIPKGSISNDYVLDLRKLEYAK